MRADGAPYAEEAAKAQAHAKGVARSPKTKSTPSTLSRTTCAAWTVSRPARPWCNQITDEGLAVMIRRDHQNGEGRTAMRSELTEVRALVENKPIMQPFGDRSKVVIEPMLTDQWFVDTDKIVGPALDAVKGRQP